MSGKSKMRGIYFPDAKLTRQRKIFLLDLDSLLMDELQKLQLQVKSREQGEHSRCLELAYCLLFLRSFRPPLYLHGRFLWSLKMTVASHTKCGFSNKITNRELQN